MQTDSTLKFCQQMPVLTEEELNKRRKNRLADAIFEYLDESSSERLIFDLKELAMEEAAHVTKRAAAVLEFCEALHVATIEQRELLELCQALSDDDNEA